LFNISVLLDVQANLPETSPFFVCPNGFGEHLFSNVYSSWDVYLWAWPKAKGIPNCSLQNQFEKKLHSCFQTIFNFFFNSFK
jgi:hypothetical protein